MNKAKKIGVTLAVAVAAAASGYGAYLWQQPREPQNPHGNTVASPENALFQAAFPDLDGRTQPLAQWRGRVLVLNFWATWCPPCRKEMPEFVQLQKEYGAKGLTFVGIAVDDKAKVQAFADELGVNYPILLGQMDAIELARQLGNRLGGLPFTVIVDPQGRIAATELGGLDREKLLHILNPLLSTASGG